MHQTKFNKGNVKKFRFKVMFVKKGILSHCDIIESKLYMNTQTSQWVGVTFQKYTTQSEWRFSIENHIRIEDRLKNDIDYMQK